MQISHCLQPKLVNKPFSKIRALSPQCPFLLLKSRSALLPLFGCAMLLRTTFLLKRVVTRKNLCSILNQLVPDSESQGLDSPNKNERLVRIMNTQRMPRRVDLHCSLSPVLWTDASARSRRSRSHRSRRTASLRSSSASCITGPWSTHARRAGSGGGGEVHTPTSRC